ncbi:MAG: hypothetical protein WCL04_06380 [Verrucomicrobiota bacterium]
MAPFRTVFVLALVLAACAPAATPAPQVVAPLPKVYACDQQRAAAAELKALPAGSVLAVFIADYGELRDKNRAALGLPKPAPCPPT